MSNVKTELKELWKIVKFFGNVFGLIAFGWLLIISLTALIGN